MCPDPGLLSAFVDGEVPSPWKDRLAAHLGVCPACAARVERYAGLGAALRAPASLDEAAVVERLRGRLGAGLESRPATRAASRAASPLWNRSVSLPLPLAAAAGLAFVLFASLALSGLLRPARQPIQSLAAAELAPSRTEPGSMEALIRYLESQDAQVNLTIQLPADATFSSSGKPLIVKASEFVPLGPSSAAPSPAELGGDE
ncbi:MAG: zf-HC2 domain-containing protein [Spirochaetaceae bacterium]|nr:zf-HC2 domain-containing protein [Spirochaetaceae bacterium]